MLTSEEEERQKQEKIQYLVCRELSSIMKKLADPGLDEGSSPGTSLIFQAIRTGKSESLEKLLDEGKKSPDLLLYDPNFSYRIVTNTPYGKVNFALLLKSMTPQEYLGELIKLANKTKEIQKSSDDSSEISLHQKELLQEISNTRDEELINSCIESLKQMKQVLDEYSQKKAPSIDEHHMDIDPPTAKAGGSSGAPSETHAHEAQSIDLSSMTLITPTIPTDTDKPQTSKESGKWTNSVSSPQPSSPQSPPPRRR